MPDKKGLVLEGGAMRGMFTAGVLDVLMKAGVEFDGAVGVSAGAAIGCNFKSKQIGRAIRYNKRFSRDPRYVGLRSFLRTGDVYGAEFDYHILPGSLDIMDAETYRNNPMEFWYVCTDLRTGKPVYHLSRELSYEDLEWMRASASMPLASRIVRVGGYELLDGGVSDSIPLRFFEKKGYRKNVVVLTQPEGYVKQPNRLLPVLRVVYRKYPEMVKAMARRHIFYNRTVEYVHRAEKEGRVLIIQPPAPLRIGAVEHDPEELQRVYDIGTAEGEKRLSDVLDFLN